MKVYKIKFRNAYSKTTYIIAHESSEMAMTLAVQAETGTFLDGTIDRPSYDCFEIDVIDGVFAKRSGIKSIIY